ncbi:MAG: peptidoglycan DD-metalloendopeptidase family protein [Desulfovibrionaceae bacterium]|jgi:murein DD-endopeptidase MepM/ murein hydrolase activator NlpD
MLFRRYQIVVFKDRQGSCRKFQVRGWMVFAVLFLMVALAAGNVVLWDYYTSHNKLQRGLAETSKTVQEQKTQLLSLSQKISSLKENLGRIRNFDSKLRVMMNIDQDSGDTVNPQGGPQADDFSEGYLPLYRQELLARKMHDFLNQLNVEAKLEEVRQQEIIQELRTNPTMVETTPSVWPAAGWVTSSFGWRTSKFTGKREFHKGIDISAPQGTPVYAPAAGKVVFSGRDGSFGLSVKISHNSSMLTRFGHLHELAVKVGQNVERGDLVGYVGNTGRSTGPHLHYEVRLAGVPVDPSHYILN